MAIATAVWSGTMPCGTCNGWHSKRLTPRSALRWLGCSQTRPLAGSTLAVDQTGVGRPVVDILLRAKVNARIQPITITGGHKANPGETSTMRIADILRLSLSALYQQKLRTLLTTLGVLSGGFVLVFSVSMGRGVQDTVVREYSRYAGLRQIDVSPMFEAPAAADAENKVQVKGTASAERLQRLGKEVARREQQTSERKPRTKLSPEMLQRLRDLPHVKTIIPDTFVNCRVRWQNHSEDVFAHSAPPDHKNLSGRTVAGAFLSAADGDAVLVTEYLLYRLGIVDDAALDGVLGKKLRLEYRAGVDKSYSFLALFSAGRAKVSSEERDLVDKVVKQLSKSLDTLDLKPAERALLKRTLQPPAAPPRTEETVVVRDFKIVGVLRANTKDDVRGYREWWIDDVDVVLPAQTATELFFEVPANRETGVSSLLVEADNIDTVKEVSQAIQELGLRTTSLLELIEREQFIYLLLFAAMTCIAVVALIVAAIGIINTMLMSVLERTREIGVMKAVGGRQSHIQAIFLLEGALIGLTGGLLGLLAAWALSKPADNWARAMVSARLNLELHGSLFVWAPWLLFGAPLFTALVTTLAAVYPARRAASVNPIAALRHE
jgi:putative ABC transport system permease protein